MNTITYGIYACEGDKHVLLEEFDGESKRRDLKLLKKRVLKLLPQKHREHILVSGTFKHNQYSLGVYLERQSHLVDDGYVTNEFYVNHRCEQLINSLYARG